MLSANSLSLDKSTIDCGVSCQIAIIRQQQKILNLYQKGYSFIILGEMHLKT